MATLNKAITKDLFDNFLPTFGNERKRVPVWDDSQKMFLCEEYESANGHRYYKGIRFCENVAIVEKVGLYHSWTYIDGIELYAFNGNKPELIQKRDYDKVFRNEELVRSESEAMIRDFLTGALKIQHVCMPAQQIAEHAKALVDGCYKSFLDHDYNPRLTQILLSIEQK